MKNLYIHIAVILLCISGCDVNLPPSELPLDRESLIPDSQIKITPGMDIYPVQSLSEDYHDPVPLPYPVNTAGAEDSAFVTPDGNTLYVWFTPDVKQPVEQQVLDGVTGIYRFVQKDGSWSGPERIVLQDSGKLALDGCEFILYNRMWFCTAREGYTGIHWFTAELVDGSWTNWKQVDFPPSYQVGELHITADGTELYFHSSRPGGKGGYDIWVSSKQAGEWSEPENIAAVNSPQTDGWPFVTEDGKELWITRGNGAPTLYRSLRVNGEWAEPVKMFSHFSGEASLDRDANVYFTHDYYQDDQILEADIFIARKK